MGLWRIANILSLDVVAGSVLGCAFFAQVFGVSLYPQAFFSLGLIVWIIYTVDHLFDAARANAEPSTARHRFHRTYRKALTVAVVIAALLVALETLYVRKPVLLAGVSVAALVIGYLALQSNLKFGKEVSGAALYTLGIIAAPWSLLERGLSGTEIMVAVLYGLTAFINLLLFSLIDRETDLKDRHTSFATIFGDGPTRAMITVCFGLLLLMSLYSLIESQDHAMAVATILAMNAVQYFTFHFRSWLAANDLYRRIGDLAFLIPGVYILYSTFD